MTNVLHETIWLTQTARDQLQSELDGLDRRAAPSPEIEARIRELRALLRRAEVGDKPDDGLVEAGMTITVQFDGDSAPATFLLGQRANAESDPSVDIDVYPPSSPLGTAIAGRYPGDRFQYLAPSGAELSGRIVAAVPFRSS
ncbi:MAG: transcription elongation factor GreA [Pseudolysinimonas sp.]